MKAVVKFSLIAVLGVALLFGTATVTKSQNPDPAAKKTYWKISGQLEEACKCNAACPCWFGSKPSHMDCGGQLVHFITKGVYGTTPLDGLAYARMGQSPNGQAMMDAYGNWIFDYLYIDEKANPEQRKALEEIAWTIQPKASNNVQIRYVPITRTIDGKMHHVKIGDVGSFSAQLMEGANGSAPKIVNAPGADPMRAEFEQGLTSAFKYTDASQSWDTKNSNYMYTDFEVDSDQYDKFNAAMMQKMKEMKKPKEGEKEHQH